MCAIRWASGKCNPPRELGHMMEGLDLARQLAAHFHHVRISANSMMDIIAKEGVNHDGLMINQSFPFS